MEIVIPVSNEERVATLKAIQQLNDIRHLKYMSVGMISETCQIKQTKLRAVLDDLVSKGLAVRYQATENPKIQRYYFVVTDAGRDLIAEEESTAEET